MVPCPLYQAKPFRAEAEVEKGFLSFSDFDFRSKT